MMEHLVCPRLQEVHKHLSDKGAPKQSIRTVMHTAGILLLYIPVIF